MSQNENVVQSVLQQDGSTELRDRPPLPNGPVEAVIRPLSQVDPASETWWQFLQRARAELEAAGASFGNGVEINAYLDQLRGEHERPDGAYWEIDWVKRHGDRS